MNNNLLDLNNLIACVYAEVINNVYDNYKKYSEIDENRFKEIIYDSDIPKPKRVRMFDEFVSQYMRRTVKLSGNLVLGFNKEFGNQDAISRLSEAIVNNSYTLFNIENGKLVIAFTGIDRDMASGGNNKILNSVLNTIKEYDVTYKEYHMTYGSKAKLINNNGRFNSRYNKLNLLEEMDSVSSYKLNDKTVFTIPYGITHCFAIVLDLSNELYDNSICLEEIVDYEEKIDPSNRHIFSSLKGIVNKDYDWYRFNDFDLMDDLIQLKDKMI